MFGPLLRNIAISAVAYSIVSAVSLLLAPLLIATYGLAGFGQIVIARLFVPNASLALFDFGMSEVATQIIAKGRQSEDWGWSLRTLGLLIVCTCVAGVLVAVLVAALSPFIPHWMGIAPELSGGLSRVILVTALLLPLLFLSLVADGIVKGFEDFKTLRACEVLSATFYGLSAVGLVAIHADVDAICYALLASLILRLISVTIAAARLLKVHGAPRPGFNRESWDFIRGWAKILSYNKMLGSLQNQIASPLIGILFGPAAVGAVDALSRLPRFAKSVLGLLNSAVLPLAARLEFAASTDDLRRLGQTGLLIVALASIPPLVAGMAFSEPLTRLWLGATLTPYWPWQAILFVVPATNTLVSFGGTVLLTRKRAASAMNGLVTLQVLTQIVLSLALIPWLHEWSFVLGQAIAVLFSFALQMRLIVRELDLSSSLYVALAKLTVISLLVGAAGLPVAHQIGNVVSLVAACAAWSLLIWAICAFAVVRADQRRLIRNMIVARFAR
jgi:O-antigen/teichoic acid export membrane protein